jgi:hypothetical protein
VLKEARKREHLVYGGERIRMTPDFSLETIQTRRQYRKILRY